MQVALNEVLANKFIICSCEGSAEKVIIDLLLDNGKLCFNRSALIDGECTMLRLPEQIALNFLNREYSKDIVILRIVDREKEKFALPKIYQLKRNVKYFDIVTHPEIEILHIIAEGLFEDFQNAKRRYKKTKPSEFFQDYATKHFRRKSSIKSAEFVCNFYSDNIPKLIDAIKFYHRQTNQSSYDLSDLLC